MVGVTPDWGSHLAGVMDATRPVTVLPRTSKPINRKGDARRAGFSLDFVIPLRFGRYRGLPLALTANDLDAAGRDLHAGRLVRGCRRPVVGGGRRRRGEGCGVHGIELNPIRPVIVDSAGRERNKEGAGSRVEQPAVER